MRETDRKELKEFHKECDDKFKSLIIVKQEYARVYGEYYADGKWTNMKINTLRKIKQRLSKEEIRKCLEEIKTMPTKGIINKETERLVKKVWDQIDNIIKRYQAFTGSPGAEDALLIHDMLVEAEQDFLSLIGVIDLTIMSEL